MPPDPRAGSADPLPPGRGLTLRLTGHQEVFAVDTWDDARRTLLRVGEGEQITTLVPLGDGFAAVASEVLSDPMTWRLVVVHDGRPRSVPLAEDTRLVAAASDDEFLVVPYGSGAAHRYSATGKPLGTVPLPPDSVLFRGVATGLLIADYAGEGEAVNLRVWDPARRRTVLALGANAYHLAATDRYVLWSSYCGRDRCPYWVTDLATGARRAVPMPRTKGDGLVRAEADPATGAVALLWRTGSEEAAVLYVAEPGDTAPRRVARTHDTRVLLTWAAPGRVVYAQVFDGSVDVRAWDDRDGVRFAGAYVGGDAEHLNAEPGAPR